MSVGSRLLRGPRAPSRRARSVPALPALLLALVAPFLLAGVGSAQASRPRVVARLQTRAPDVPEFLLRGTVPVPPGTFPAFPNRAPFTILDYDGTPVFTQVEVVSRYPDERDGADVVELLARVRRDPAVPANSVVSYPVVHQYMNPPSIGPGPLVQDAVRQLLDNPDGVRITSYDCFGNAYVCRPLDKMNTYDMEHRGPVHTEVRLYQTQLPEPPVPGSTLPHLFGVHSYLSLSRDSGVVGLDLRFHNAHDGHDPQDPRDDPLGTVYFERIELSVPEGWTVQQDFADPLFGAERLENGRRIVSIVAPEPTGGLHVMRWQGQFHRRLALAPDRPNAQRAARVQLDGGGRAFCVRGFDVRGREYWSWWNRDTARYFPQRLQLPRLDSLNPGALDAAIDGELDDLSTHLADGTGTGGYPLAAPRLGWGHPYGVSYGGMTGGLEIQFYDGIEIAAAASPNGFRLTSLLHRMQTDRQANALYQLGGQPSSVEEWRIDTGTDAYVPFEHFVVPLVFGSRPDPFGVRGAPTFQVDYVEANGLKPAYEGQYLGFDPYDYQHFVRYTRSAKVLVWLANDSLAKDDLCLQAEMFNLSFHPLANNPGGGFQGSGMRAMQTFVAAHPGNGCGFGRGEGWGVDCVVASYACSPRDWRATKLPWLKQQAELLMQGQASCSGFIQAFVNTKAVGGKYRARQAIEQSITENALVCLHESVFRDAWPGYAAMTRDVLVRSLDAFVGEMSWFPGQNGPWRYTGVGPLDPSVPGWCSQAEMPPDAWTVGDIETFQDWSSLAYGYDLTADPKFLQAAGLQLGVQDFPEMASLLRLQGTTNLGNRAALLALVQRLQGEL